VICGILRPQGLSRCCQQQAIVRGGHPSTHLCRTTRAMEAELLYHVLNRGNGGMPLFDEPADYEGFEEILAASLER
jgi:hypothetical protein